VIETLQVDVAMVEYRLSRLAEGRLRDSLHGGDERILRKREHTETGTHEAPMQSSAEPLGHYMRMQKPRDHAVCVYVFVLMCACVCARMYSHTSVCVCVCSHEAYSHPHWSAQTNSTTIEPNQIEWM